MMNLATLAVDPTVAREKLAEYRRSVKERHTAEDALIMKGFREIVRGRMVIDIVATIRQGGTYRRPNRSRTAEVDLPHLAVLRADADVCRVSRGSDGSVTYYGGSRPWGPRGNERRYVEHMPTETLPRIEWAQSTRWEFMTQVPHVPPSLRPNDSLGNYHILWEAEWMLTPQPPGDPALLKHIGGDLYAVLATWDLTPIEIAVLTRR